MPAARSSTSSASAPKPPTASAPRSSTTSFPTSSYLSMSELFGGPLLTEFSRSLTRARVQQYQRYFADADRVLIMLHNDPDPDAMASGLALRNVLRRTKTTAIIGAIQGVTRPENLRMVNLLDIHVETDHAGVAQGVRPDRDGRRAAALLRRPHRPGRPGHRPSPRAARLHGRLQGHPRRLRLDVHDSHRAPARRRRQHLRADGDGDALRDQVGHAVLQPADQPRRHRGLLVSLPAGRRGADPQDGRRGNHARAARLRARGAPQRARSTIRSSARSSAPRRARTSSPTSPTSSCSSRTSSGPSSPASSTTR